MYDENQQPLPPGDAREVFAEELMELQRQATVAALPPLNDRQVLFWAESRLREPLIRISRRLLLPGSGLVGLDNLRELTQRAAAGESCLICFNHRSNLDVPTLATLLEDAGQPELFDRLIWVAGRKLQEDAGLTGTLLRAFHRVLVTPRTWLEERHSSSERRAAQRINRAAHRAILRLRHQNWIFALFPAGTRVRPGDLGTRRAIPETDSYLKAFDVMVLAHIEGCTLPVSRARDLTREIPRLDRVRISFGPVTRTAAWRREATARYPQLDRREATARAIMADIGALNCVVRTTSGD